MLPEQPIAIGIFTLLVVKDIKKRMSKNIPQIVLKLNMFKQILRSNLLPLSTLKIIKFGFFDFEVILVG